MNLLIIEDEPTLSRMLVHLFKKTHSFEHIHACQDFREGLWRGKSDGYNLIITDLMFEKSTENGLNICEKIRQANPEVPIIVITAIKSIQLLEKAFSLGVNDYITKPFHPKELVVRALRRSLLIQQKNNMSIKYYDLSYNIQTQQVFWKNTPIKMGKRTKNLLLIFLRKPETLLSSAYLQQYHWADVELEQMRNIRASIYLLRKQLHPWCDSWIQNIPYTGYILKKYTKRESIESLPLHNYEKNSLNT